jgi:type IV secretion system protein VirD4
VLPTLLTWPHSALVLDIKGENYALTSGWHQSLGHNVFKFDPAAHQAGASARFNFLDTVRLGTKREVADAQRLARALVDPNGELMRASGNGSNHWLATAIGLLTAAILHVLYRERAAGRPPASLGDVLDELATDTKSFTELLLEWLAFPHDPKLVQGWTDGQNLPTCTHKIVRTVASLQLKKDEKERNAILSSTVTALDVFQDPVLTANTSRSDFRIEDLMDAERPTTVYLVLRPDDLKRLGTLSRVFLEVALRRLMAGMEFVDGRQHGTHRHRLLLLLDEFTSLGRLDIVAESIAYMRGYGIKALILIQNLVQLRKEYGRDEPISVNCALCGAYAPSKVDVETAKTLSAMTGTTTILRKSTSRTLSFGFLTSKGSSQTESEVSRPLLTPGECTELPTAVKRGGDIVSPGHMLAFAAGAPAIYGQQFLFFRDPELLRRSRLPAAPARPNASADTAATPAAGGRAPVTRNHQTYPGATAGEPEAVGSSDASGAFDHDFELDEEIMKYGLDHGSDGEGAIDD